jgi:hypothetical protein
MASPINAATWALTAARRLQGLCSVVLKRCRVADEERAEPGMELGGMQSTGVRNRRVPQQIPERADDHTDSPATSPTTSTASGTLTPGTSEGVSEAPGMIGLQESPRYKLANAGNT